MEKDLDTFSAAISMAMFKVIELHYSQKVAVTWRDIYLFLRVPEYIWIDEDDLDEKIIIENDEALEMMREMLTARFNTLH